jgi:hypothetical protein
MQKQLYPAGGEAMGPKVRVYVVAPMVRVDGRSTGPDTVGIATGKLATAAVLSMVKLMVVEPPSWYRTTWSTAPSTRRSGEPKKTRKS